MDVVFSQKSKDSIKEYSKNYTWFSDLYNSMFKVIEQTSKQALSHMSNNECIVRTKENWKQVCKVSVYRLGITYMVAKIDNRHVLFIVKVELS